MATAVVVKKGPGRPKKNIPAAPIAVQGIVAAPSNPEYLLEMVYSNPRMFKKLFGLFKAYEAHDLEISFNANGFKINALDHYQQATIYTTIDGRCMNSYYCKNPMRICVCRTDIERVFCTIDKNHSNISFILREDWRSVMHILVRDTEYSSEEAYDIDVNFKPEEIITGAADDDTNYPLKFTLACGHFKAQINNIDKIAKTFAVQKTAQSHLQLTSVGGEKVTWTKVYPDKDKLKLVDRLRPDDIFNVPISIQYVKPLSGSNVGDEVQIAADMGQRMSFTIHLDKRGDLHACCIKVFINIVQPNVGI